MGGGGVFPTAQLKYSNFTYSLRRLVPIAHLLDSVRRSLSLSLLDIILGIRERGRGLEGLVLL